MVTGEGRADICGEHTKAGRKVPDGSGVGLQATIVAVSPPSNF